MVIAGRCAANCVVELLSNGEPHDKAAADAGGNWAMTPRPLPPGEYELGLKVTGPDGKASLAEQTVTVAVPKPPSRDVLVVVNEPNAPSRILQKPETLTARAGPDKASPGVAAGGGATLSIAAVDAENGRFFAQGLGPAGVRLRIYLNNAPIADAVIGRDGRWSLRVERGLSPGEYVMRLDALDPASGKVAARAETRFAYAPEVAAATPKSAPELRLKLARRRAAEPQASVPPPAAPEPGRAASSPPPTATAERRSAPTTAEQQPSAAAPGTPAAEPEPPAAAQEPDAANPVVASIDTATVRRGDSLWRISRSIYGQGRRFTVIFEANGQIRNPNLIYPGQVLVLPTEQAGSASATGRP
jgi:nucleoid-associated protein YgaU